MVAQIDKDYRHLGTGFLVRRVASWMFFEGRPHTTRGQWFNPVVFGLLKLIDRFPGTPDVDRPIFITGLGRSGTTLIGKIVSAHPRVGYLNEAKAIWSMIEPSSDVCADYVQSNPSFRLCEANVDSRARRSARRLFGRYGTFIFRPRIADKYPELIFRTRYIKTIFPDARIVFVTRNGIDACQSIATWSDRNADFAGEDWWGRNDVKWKTLVKEFLSEDSRYPEIARTSPKVFNATDRAAIEWLVTTDYGLSLNDSKIHRFRYEDLVANPAHAVNELLTMCDLDLADGESARRYAVDAVHASTPYSLPVLHPAIQPAFERVMAKAGYDIPAE